MKKLLYVYLDHAFTSEAALREHRSVSPDEASWFEYEGETPGCLWRAQGGPEVDLITANRDEAVAEFEAGAQCLYRIKVVGVDPEEAPGRLVLSRGGGENAPDFGSEPPR